LSLIYCLDNLVLMASEITDASHTLLSKESTKVVLCPAQAANEKIITNAKDSKKAFFNI